MGWGKLNDGDKELLAGVFEDQRKQRNAVIAVVVGIGVFAPIDYFILRSMTPAGFGGGLGSRVTESLALVVGAEILILVGLYVYFRRGRKALDDLM